MLCRSAAVLRCQGVRPGSEGGVSRMRSYSQDLTCPVAPEVIAGDANKRIGVSVVGGTFTVAYGDFTSHCDQATDPGCRARAGIL